MTESASSMNILFISFFFPPYKAIASVRTWHICRGLLAAGHSVRVATVDSSCLATSQTEIVPGMETVENLPGFSRLSIRVPWPDLFGGEAAAGRWRKLVTRLVAKLLIWGGFDPSLPWSLAAWRQLRRQKGYDLVLVSGGPFSTFIPAVLLARKNGCRLALDYRDVWNGSPHLRTRIPWTFLERRWLRRADLVTSVSPSCLESILAGVQRPAAIITNGVGDDVYDYRRLHLQAADPLIVYAGAFFPPRRSVEPFFAGWRQGLVRFPHLKDLRFVYLGPSVAHVQAVATRYGLSDKVECRGTVSHQESLSMQAKAMATLVVTTVEACVDGPDRGILTGKLFEAIELARHVLVICPDNSDARALTKDISHVCHLNGTQIEAIGEWLGEMMIGATPLRESQEPHFSWGRLADHYVRCLASAVGDS